MNFVFTHEFDVEPEGFWQLFFSEAYEKELFRCLKMRGYTVLERKDEGNRYRRALKLDPEMEIPSWATAVVREAGYIEHDLLHRDRSVMDVTIEPLTMKSRFYLAGQFKVTPVGAGRCRREFSGEIRISVPLLGGKIEKFLVERMREGYDAAAAMTRDWIARGKATAQASRDGSAT
jgi:hypothetical protein